LQVWQAIAQRLDQAAIDSLDGLLFGQAWSDLLCLDVQQWQQYEVLQSAQHERKAIVQVQFSDLDQPVVLAFCQVPGGPWLLSGLYVRGARWIYQPDWPEVLEKGQWPQFLHCP
jgi:hypothetical protein